MILDKPFPNNGKCVICGVDINDIRLFRTTDNYKGASTAGVTKNTCNDTCRAKVYRLREKREMIKKYITVGDLRYLRGITFADIDKLGFKIIIMDKV